MSERPWGRDLFFTLIAAGLLVAITATATGFVLDQYSKVHSAYSAYLQNAKAQRREAAQKASQACQNSDPATLRNCIADQLESYGSQQAANEDLKAQKDMAFWAMFAVFVAFFALIATGIGIYLIWRTLHYTRQAAEFAAATLEEAEETVTVTRELGAAQIRAYVAVANLRVRNFAEGKIPEIKYTAKNVGQSPAFGFQNFVIWDVVDDPETAKILDLGDMWTGNRIDIPGTARTMRTIRLDDLTFEEFQEVVTGQKVFMFAGAIRYRDVFKKQQRGVFRAYLDPADLKNGKAGLTPTIRGNRSS